MENTTGTSPLQALVLTESFQGKTDQQILDILARHLSFTPEAAESIKGDTGATGATGADGTPGADGADGVTPTQQTEIFSLNAGITEFSLNESLATVTQATISLVWDDASAPTASEIAYYHNTGTAVDVVFNNALTGDNWKLYVVKWV